MPKALHRRLSRQATKKGLKGERKDAYVYGTLHRIEERRKAKRRRAASKPKSGSRKSSRKTSRKTTRKRRR